MAKSGDVLSVPELGAQIRFLETAAETGGARTQFEVIGRPRGFLVQPHVHVGQTERFEPVEGAMELVTGGRTHVLQAGDALEVRPGAAHIQRPSGPGDGTVRVTVTPAGRTEAFLERLAAFSRDGRLLRGGWPRPTAAAELVRDFGDEGHAAKPPVRGPARGGDRDPRRRPARRDGPRPRRRGDRQRVPVRRRVGRRRAAARRSSPRSPTRAPTRSGGRPSTSTWRRTARPRSARSRASTSRAACPTTCTRARGSRASSPARRRGRRRRRPARPRDLDADDHTGRHPRALRLARVRRPTAAARC